MEATQEGTSIFGSVSIVDIFHEIKATLTQSAVASGRIPLGPEHVRLVGVTDTDRLKTLGTWEVDILVPGDADLEPLRRTVMITATVDGRQPGTTGGGD